MYYSNFQNNVKIKMNVSDFNWFTSLYFQVFVYSLINFVKTSFSWRFVIKLCMYTSFSCYVPKNGSLFLLCNILESWIDNIPNFFFVIKGSTIFKKIVVPSNIVTPPHQATTFAPEISTVASFILGNRHYVSTFFIHR